MIFAIGLPVNTTALVAFIRNKKLKKIGPLFMYRLMFGLDAAYLFGIFVIFLGKGFHLSLYLISDLSCKLFFYFSYSGIPYSCFILAYLSLDRFVSIKYYAQRLLLKKSKNQYIYVLSFVLFDYIYNIPVFLHYKLFTNSENALCKVKIQRSYLT